jgi:hypothetical protein
VMPEPFTDDEAEVDAEAEDDIEADNCGEV